MNWTYRQLTRSTLEALGLQQSKTHLSIGHDDDDVNIADDIQAALRVCEEYTGQVFGPRSFVMSGTCWPDDGSREIRFPIEPVISVTSVKYKDESSDEQTVAGSNYRTWLDHSPPILRLTTAFSMPGLDLDEPAPISIEFVAGQEEIPEQLRKAIQLTLGFWRQFPGGEPSLGHLSRGLPGGAIALLDTLWTGAQ